VVSPGMGKGEFVEVSVTEENEKGPWTALAKLTKSDVDTFLFLTFSWPQDMDLSREAYITFDLGVPESQECGNRMLVLLRDLRGVEYLCDTQVRLNANENGPVYVPLSAFARAGWNTVPEGPIDLKKIRDIRIGWGGYTGREGEKIVFRTSAPGLAGQY